MTQPLARNEHVDIPEAFPPGHSIAPDLWTEVHDEVQGQLASIEAEVRRKLPGVRVVAGRTKGQQFFLFSYRTFSMPDSALDPVVVGMTFTAAGQGVKVEADVSGEQTGDMISSVSSKTVADSRQELLAATCESARKLRDSAEIIVAGLKDPSRTVE